ncbi:MAG TPA: hypothetical protein PLQ89_03070 [Phycisphaerae bacterium]|nr:hypothetical protein [Phycisphaerae bacterium]
MSDRVNAHGLNSYITIFILMAALVIGAPAFADVASYESDFTNFGGSDASSISTISSSTGNMPGSNWTVTTSSGVGAGWLTQGTIDGTPTTVKFFHNSATTNAKARFSTWLPPLWRAIGLQDTTLIVEYRMKYGVGYNATIGAIQIVYPTRYANFDSVIRVRQTAPDANTLVMPRREGGDAVGVNELDLGRDINGEWHDWRVEVRYGEYANYDTKLRYYLPGPFADADEDGDVDMNDFAAFQRCWTQADDPESTFDASKCGRFDQDGDSDVDEDDLSAFAACATGAEVVWTSTPGCP